MKRTLAFLLAFFLVVPLSLRAGEKLKGEISFMPYHVEEDDSQVKVREYESEDVENSVEVKAKIEKGSFGFDVHFVDDEDWDAKMHFGLQRFFKVEAFGSKMPHYYGHEIPFPEGYPNYTTVRFDRFVIVNKPNIDRLPDNGGAGTPWAGKPFFRDVTGDGLEDFAGMTKGGRAPLVFVNDIANEKAGKAFGWNDANGNGIVDAGDGKYGGKHVQYTDLSVGDDYAITRTKFGADAEMNIPAVAGMKIFMNFHAETKEGTRQAYFMSSKCAACHINTYGREINELTKSFKAGLRITRKFWGFEYYHQKKDFTDSASPFVATFDPVGHPVTGGYASPNLGVLRGVLANTGIDFKGRVLYGDGDQLPVNVTPDVQKTLDVFKLYLRGLPFYSKLLLSYVTTNTESQRDKDAPADIYNREDINSDFDAFSAKLTARPLKGLKLSFRFRHYEVDPDTVVVDLYNLNSRKYATVDHNGDGVPDMVNGWLTIGKTPFGFAPVLEPMKNDPLYANGYYHYVSDYVLDRDVDEYGISLSYILFGKYTLNLSWDREDIDRGGKSYQAPGYDYDDTTVDTYTFSIGGNLLSKKVSARFTFKYDNIDDPFGLDAMKAPNGGCTGDIYDAWQASRILHGSADPEDVYTYKLNLTIQPFENLVLNLYGKYSDQDNDKADWDKDVLALGFMATASIGKRVTFNFGYDYQNIQTDAVLTTGLFDG